jgi:hypothetical protein
MHLLDSSACSRSLSIVKVMFWIWAEVIALTHSSQRDDRVRILVLKYSLPFYRGSCAVWCLCVIVIHRHHSCYSILFILHRPYSVYTISRDTSRHIRTDLILYISGMWETGSIRCKRDRTPPGSARVCPTLLFSLNNISIVIALTTILSLIDTNSYITSYTLGFTLDTYHRRLWS